MFYIADIFTMGVQYGTRTAMCKNLTSAGGDTLENLAKYGMSKHVAAWQYDASTLSNTTIDINKNFRQWTYQYCTTFGWW